MLVRAQDTTDEIERAIARISEQMNSNNHRTGLTTAQNAAGIAEMLDLGVPVERVSKELSVKRKAVKLLGAAGRRDAARTSLEEQGLTIEQAAVIATFEAEGDTEAVETLAQCHRRSFDYQARMLLADQKCGQATTQRGTRIACRSVSRGNPHRPTARPGAHRCPGRRRRGNTPGRRRPRRRSPAPTRSVRRWGDAAAGRWRRRCCARAR